MTQPASAKRALRRELLAARSHLDGAALATAGRDLTQVLLDTPEVAEARTVAAFWPTAGEPDIRLLLQHLDGAGAAVLLPVLGADDDLDWARWQPSAGVRMGRRGLAEPVGPLLGRDAASSADVVLVPGLAVDRRGRRLGRGGGSYDRVLPRLSPEQLVIVVLHDHEVLETVPTDPHDRPVHAVATPSGLLRLPPLS
jgi:5-formyltetrahydrofolate cyclo-ligase